MEPAAFLLHIFGGGMLFLGKREAVSFQPDQKRRRKVGVEGLVLVADREGRYQASNYCQIKPPLIS